MNRILFFALLVFSFSTVNAQNASLWKRINQGGISLSDRVNAKPDLAGQLVFELDEMAMSQSLQLANGKTAKESQVQIAIPNAKGILETFLVWESSNFAPELQTKFPEIRAYAGTGITDRNATIHFSFSPKGIQTMILRGDSESEFIERYAKSKSVYVLFNSKSRKKGNLSFACKTEDVALNKQLYKKTSKIISNTGVFKTLRLALSCTGEYTTFHGGTVNGALTAMNATMTRVNGIFNKDLAIQLNLVATNTNIIFTDAATDPYSDEAVGLATVTGCTGNGCPGTWNKEVQSTITSVIGEANYDIGHLFAATGGGGDAGCIGCICDALTATNSTPPYQLGKGSAYTSPSDGISQGDTFDIDFVAHEMGHQLGANHTYSYDIEGTDMSVEPGSGSTIMGYAGITDYNVQSNSDDYFTYVSIKQIQDNLATKSILASTSLTGQTPTVNAGLDYTIPKGTAFVLTGTGSDPNGNTLTYCWEQNDTALTESGANSIAFPTKVDGPLFRSLKPTSSPVRYMPVLNSVLINKLSTTWESVSDVARTLHFTLTARDNAAQGFAQTNTDTKIVTVSGTIGPFAVTSQNVADSSWPLGSSQTITWSVNGTNTLPGSSNVNIKLSTDGGLTFPTSLATNTPNDGSETITAPGVAKENCRILIEPTANIYYAINSEPFAIGYAVTSTCNTYNFAAPFAIVDSQSYTAKTITVPASAGVISDVNVAVDFTHTYLSDVQIEVINPQGTTVKLFERSCNQSGSLILNYDDLGVALACGATTAQTVSPFEPLNVFNGLNPQGSWQFRVRDAYVSDTGTLNSAAITICTKSYATLAAPSFDIGNFVVYPNPNKGNFNIQFTSTAMSGVKVLVHDLLGRKIYENKFSNGVSFNENIQLKNARTGIYLLTVIDGDRKEVKKLVIE
jgi:subtilisin-like proprotein convertase family protein